MEVLTLIILFGIAAVVSIIVDHLGYLENDDINNDMISDIHDNDLLSDKDE